MIALKLCSLVLGAGVLLYVFSPDLGEEFVLAIVSCLG